MPTDLMVFSDYACPWCYLGRARMKEAIAGRDVKPIVMHFPLAADTPQEGRAVRPYLEAKGLDVDDAVFRLSALLEDEGLPYLGDADRMRSYNTRLAQELAVWAEQLPGGEAIHDALFHAYHVDNVNLAEVDVLVGIASGLGLDADQARAVLIDRRFERQVDAHWALASRLGVRSVPTFVAHGRGVVGAQPATAIVRLLESPPAS